MKTNPPDPKPTHPTAEAMSRNSALRSGKCPGAVAPGKSEKVSSVPPSPPPASTAPISPGEPFALVPPPDPDAWDPRSNVIDFPRPATPEAPEQMWVILYTTISHRHARRRGRSAEDVKERLRSTLARCKGAVLGEILACFPAREMNDGEWFPPARPPEAADLGAGI